MVSRKATLMLRRAEAFTVGQKLYDDFKVAWQGIAGEVDAITKRDFSRLSGSYLIQLAERDPEKALKIIAGSRSVQVLLSSGHALSKWILEHKSIPKSKARDLEKGLKIFISARRAPRNLAMWVQKTAPGAHAMLESRGWPNKADQAPGDEAFAIGSFKVHNTIGLEGRELENAKKIILQAEKTLRSSKVKQAKSLLYGPVMLVAKLSQPQTIAWYYPADDTIYLRPLAKVDLGGVHFLVHELGHRYWRKNATSDQKAAWLRHHRSIKDRGESEPALGPKEEKIIEKLKKLKEGDIFPLEIHGMIRGGKPVVTSVHPQPSGNILWKIETPKGKRATTDLRGWIRTLMEHASKKRIVGNYPTAYSATDHEEHFCEAFAMYSMGKLPLEHVEDFERIWVR